MRAGIVAWLWSRLVTSVSVEKSLHIMWIVDRFLGSSAALCVRSVHGQEGKVGGKRAFRQVARHAQEQVGEGN